MLSCKGVTSWIISLLFCSGYWKFVNILLTARENYVGLQLLVHFTVLILLSLYCQYYLDWIYYRLLYGTDGLQICYIWYLSIKINLNWWTFFQVSEHEFNFVTNFWPNEPTNNDNIWIREVNRFSRVAHILQGKFDKVPAVTMHIT
jgi:hypothetical protein